MGAFEGVVATWLVRADDTSGEAAGSARSSRRCSSSSTRPGNAQAPARPGVRLVRALAPATGRCRWTRPGTSSPTWPSRSSARATPSTEVAGQARRVFPRGRPARLGDPARSRRRSTSTRRRPTSASSRPATTSTAAP